MAKEERQKCDKCGAMVPEKENAPYSSHKKGCEYVKQWLKKEDMDQLAERVLKVLNES